MLPSASFAQMTEEQIYLMNASFSVGSLKTVCILYEEGVLTREEVSLYSAGYIDSIRQKETGASLAGSLKGLDKSKEDHPDCPLPD